MLSLLPTALAASLLLSAPALAIVAVPAALLANATEAVNATVPVPSLVDTNATLPVAVAPGNSSSVDFGVGNVTIASPNATFAVPISSANVTATNITIATANGTLIIPLHPSELAPEAAVTSTVLETSTAVEYWTATVTETAYETTVATSTAYETTVATSNAYETSVETSTAYETQTETAYATRTSTATEVMTVTHTAVASAAAVGGAIGKVAAALGDAGLVQALPTITLTLVPIKGSDGQWAYSVASGPVVTAAAASVVDAISTTAHQHGPPAAFVTSPAAYASPTAEPFTYTLPGVPSVQIGAGTSSVKPVPTESIITEAPEASAHAIPEEIISSALSVGRAGRPTYLSSALAAVATATAIHPVAANETNSWNGTASALWNGTDAAAWNETAPSNASANATALSWSLSTTNETSSVIVESSSPSAVNLPPSTVESASASVSASSVV